MPIKNNQGSDNIPLLRFPEFQGEWEKKKLGEVLTIGSGRDYKHLGEGEIPVFGTGGLMTKVDDYLYDGETVCIGRKGTIDKPMYFNGKIWTVDTLFYTHSFINSTPKFVYNLFQRVNWKQYNEAGGVPSLSKSTIEQIELVLPSLPEQTKIATFLTAVDEKIQALKKKHSLLEQYKKGVMQKLFSQETEERGSRTPLKNNKKGEQLRFKDENGNDFPDWEVKKFGEYIKLYRGSSPRPINLFITKESKGVNWIKIGDTKNCKNYLIDNVEEKITIEGAKKSREVFKGELILANSMSFGKTYLLDLDGCIYDGWFVLREFEKHFNREYLHQLLNSDYLQKQYKILSTGGVVQNISSEIVYDTFLLKPCLAEQTAIANFLSSLDEKINQTQRQIEKTETWKKGLLQKMFC